MNVAPAPVAPVTKALPPRPGIELPALRRFELADINTHGGWLADRLLAAYPHLTNRELQGWLKGILYSPECLFLYQDNSVALAQVIRTYTLAPRPVIQERFVFAQDQKNDSHIKQAANFYDEIKRWAVNQNVDTIIVGEMTDVPLALMKDKLGSLFERKQTFARVKHD